MTLLLLAQQVVALALAGALACCETTPVPAAAEMACCKNGGDGHMCPLGNGRAPDRGDTGCKMRKGCSTPSSGILAGAGFVYAAPLVGRFSIVPPVGQRSPLQVHVVAEPFMTVPPPSPPPKP
jgi:hypothetical protein